MVKFFSVIVLMRVRPLRSFGDSPISDWGSVDVVVLSFGLISQDLVGLSHELEHELRVVRPVVVLKN